jgi:flagellin
MRRQIRGLDQATDNIQDGISLVQIADGALAESMDNMQRVNELAVKAANETLTDADRSYIQEEVKQLLKEVDRTAQTTSFNDKIFPLNGDKISNELPKTIGEVSMPVSNLGTGTVTYNGNSYGPGESFIATNVLAITDGGNPPNSKMAAIGEIHDGGGGGMFTGSVYPIITNSDSTLFHKTMEDIMITEDGFVYFDGFYPGQTNDPWYATKDRFTPIAPTEETANEYLRMEKNQEKSDPLYILAGSEADQVIDIEMVNATSEGLGVGSISLSTAAAARESIDKVKNAIAKIAEYRSNFGAKQNRLEHAYNNVNNAVENTQHAESIIRDTDMATEMVKYSNNNILIQAGQSMLAQANQTNQGVMSLLQ